MEGRDPSGLSNLQQQQQQHPFSAILQRPIHPQSPQHQHQHHPQQQQSPGIHHFPSPPLHAPSALRPASSTPLASPSLSGASGGFSGDASPMAFSPQQQGQQQQPGMPRPGEPVKRKRGRPRKYGDAAGGVASPVAATTTGGTTGSSVSLALTPLSSVNPISSPPSEKRRGRPPGSGRKQQLAALGSAGQGFTPHVITIAAGEDVATKIMSFSQTGPRAVCVLSANGAISNVTLRQPATSGGTVTYEGRFEILSLSGSFLLTESGGTRSRTGGLSVSLAGPDGRVVGGGVAGLLMAASPVQVVVGSFIADTRKSVISRPLEAGQGGGGGGGGASGSGGAAGIQRASKMEGPRSPDSMEHQQGGGGGGGGMLHSHSPVPGMGGLQSLGWASGQSLSEPRRDTDINIPLPGG